MRIERYHAPRAAASDNRHAAAPARFGTEPMLVHPASLLLFVRSVLLGAVAAGAACAIAGALFSLAFVALT